MPQNTNLLGAGSASGPGAGTGTDFSSMLGLGTPGNLPNYAAAAQEAPTGGWRSRTASQVQNIGGQVGQMGLTNLGAASSALGLPLNYWSAILSGNPQAAMQAASPAVNSVLAQYDTARQQTATLAPRGGGQITTMTQAPFAEAGTIANLLSQAQSQAAQGVTSNAAILGQMGLSETDLGTSALGDVLKTILGEEQIGLARQAQQFKEAMAIGGALAGVAGGFAGGGADVSQSVPGGFGVGALDPNAVLGQMGLPSFGGGGGGAG